MDAHRDEAFVPRSVGAFRRRRKGLRRVGLPRHPPRRVDSRPARHRARHGARDHRPGRGHGRGPPPVQDPREVLPDERLVPRRDAHADRARRSPDGALGSEPGGEPRRGLRLRRGQSPGAAASGQSAAPAVRGAGRQRGRAGPQRHSSGRHRRHADGRVVGLLDDGRQLGGTPDGAVAGDVGGWLAVLRPAEEPWPVAAHLGQAGHGHDHAADRAVPTQRRLLGDASPADLAMEPRARRRQVVALGAPGPPPSARAGGGRSARRAQHPDAARHRPAIDADRGARRVGTEARRRGRSGALQPPLRVARRQRGRRRPGAHLRHRGRRPRRARAAGARAASGCAPRATSSARRRASATARTAGTSSRSAIRSGWCSS